jgi:RNA polymerase primary sigma factor
MDAATKNRRGFSLASEDDVDVLRAYFAEMAKIDTLPIEQEQAAAREIESLEIALWRELLSVPSLHADVIAVVRATAPRHLDVSFMKAPLTVDDELAKQLRGVDDGRLVAAAVNAALAARFARAEARRGVAFKRRVRDAHFAREQARNTFVTANLRLVISIARKFNNGRLPLADLIQEGNIGLIRAVARYDLGKGTRFSTYASWWIRHAIGRALADKGRAIRLPVGIIAEQYRLRGAERKLAGELGREPTDNEVAARLKTTPERLLSLRLWCREDYLRLDHPHPIYKTGSHGDKLLAEAIAEPEAWSAHQASSDDESVAPHITSTEQDQTLAAVRSLIPTLKPIEADILRHRFNLDGGGELTLKEIGKRYELSRERIRQLQEQALDKLRVALAKRGIT